MAYRFILEVSRTEWLPLKDGKWRAWGNRCQHMLNNGEYGFVYLLLLENYAPVYKQNKKFDIAKLLQSSNLPEEDVIYKMVLSEMDIIIAEAFQQPTLKEVFLPQLEKGRGLFSNLGIGFNKNYIEQVILGKTPTLICNDTDIEMKSYRDAELFDMITTGALTISDWYNISVGMNIKLTQFYDVRGI